MKNSWILLVLLVLVSCKQKGTDTFTHCLVPTGEVKSFPLDSDVKYNAFFLYTFQEANGKEFLSFLNYGRGQILFYDVKTADFLFKTKLAAEGPNGIIQPSGLYVKDLENIFVSSYTYNGLIKVDTTGQIIQKIPYGTTAEGYKILPSYTPSSHPFVAPLFIDGKMYITQPDGRFSSLEETPLTVSIDTINKKYEQLPLTYSCLPKDAVQTNDLRFGRAFDGERFVYSFYVNENLFVASANDSVYEIVKTKSKYIDNPSRIQKSGDQGPRSNLEVARYGDIVYDSFRKVYYRFAYPESQLDPKINWRGRAVYGREKSSVIILNEKLEIIGETLLPDATYNTYVFFVNKDGLYISKDYQMNFNQSEDYMTFELMRLKEL